MSVDPTEYDVEALYASDPEAVTAEIIKAAATSAAAEVAALHNTRLEEDFARVRQGQTESASLVAQQELEGKYGAEEFKRLLPKISAKLEESPHLVPDDALTSPGALARALDDVVKLAQIEAKAEDDANAWENIKASNTNIPRIWL